MYYAEHSVTDEILWRAAIVFALIDTLLLRYLVKKLSGQTFRLLKTFLTITSGLFWFVVWLVMCIYFWEPVYQYVFPSWSRWLIPPAYGILFALIALLFWQISVRLHGNPVMIFCALGGLWGMLTHLWGISRGLIDKPPMLKGLNALPVAVMPVFEFIFYWCIILSIALFVSRHSHRRGDGGN